MSDYPILDESTRTDDGHWIHKPCGELLDGKVVHHPIWVRGMGACAGDGNVMQVVVPFCKTCGPEPSSHGAPVYAD